LHLCAVHVFKKMTELVNKKYAISNQLEYNKKLKYILGAMFSIQT
jgi:hypothetical protein